MSTKRASGRSRTIVAKAASISRLVLALRTWISNPVARAANCASLNVVSELGPVGLTSTATANCSGYQLAHESQPLCHQLSAEKIDSCEVAARPGEACDKTDFHWVFGQEEDDRDGRGCRLSHPRTIGERGDHGNLAPNQISRQSWQPIDLILREAVYDRHVLALNEALFLQALAEFAQPLTKPVRRGAVEEPDHRHCRRLRARDERPHCPRAA